MNEERLFSGRWIDELRPCPSCGGRFVMAQEDWLNYPVQGMFYIFHEHSSRGKNCTVQVPNHFHSMRAAIEAWNWPRIERINEEGLFGPSLMLIDFVRSPSEYGEKSEEEPEEESCEFTHKFGPFAVNTIEVTGIVK